MEPSDAEQDNEITGPQEVSRKDFIALYNTWHAALGTALIGCLNSTEYMHTRTGLVVLTRLVEVFPTRPRFGNRLIAALEPLQDEQSDRPDIRASANAYGTMLLKARDDGKWIEEDAAVAKARADKEKAAAEERKKKLAEQFEELERDSEKITEEIGPRDGFERRRGDARGDARGFGASRATGPPVPDRRETGEVVGRDTRHASDRRSPPRDTDRRRDREVDRGGDRGHGRGESMAEPAARGGERHSAERPRRDGGDRGGRMDDRGGGRWTRGEAPPIAESGRGIRAPKRGRAPSPEPGLDERGGSKRPRLEPDNTFDSRREAPTRAPSPPRRGRGGGPESSRNSKSRRRR